MPIYIPIDKLFKFVKVVINAVKHHRSLSLTRRGIWFWYKGDKVLWRWWYCRNPKQPKNYLMPQQGKYVSTLCEGCFNSLREMDRFWKQYKDYCEQEKDEDI